MTPEELKEIRALCKCSQKEFALRLGVTLATLQNWEQGRYPIAAIAQNILRRLRENSGLRKSFFPKS